MCVPLTGYDLKLKETDATLVTHVSETDLGAKLCLTMVCAKSGLGDKASDTRSNCSTYSALLLR